MIFQYPKGQRLNAPGLLFGRQPMTHTNVDESVVC